MKSSFSNGPKNEKPRSDLRVHYIPSEEPISFKIKSKVSALFQESLVQQVRKVCADLGITTGAFEIEDFGALPFVVSARLEAVIKQAHTELKEETLPPMQHFSTYPTTKERLRRSRLYLPGNQPKLMLNAGIHKPDCIILDLEDSVPLEEKEAARLIVRNALRSIDFFGAERMVRINQGGLGLKDLKVLAPHNIHVVLIPKAETKEQIAQIDQLTEKTTFLMPIIESGLGIMNVMEIVNASPKIVALTIGLEDYTADIGAERTDSGKESFFARSMIVNAARSVGIQAIDSVYSDLGNSDGLKASTLESKSLGFDGKGCIHPNQIKVIHQNFAPSDQEIKKAKRVLLAYENAQEQGLGVVSLDSKMIDPPVVKRSMQTVEMAITTGLLNKDWKDDANG